MYEKNCYYILLINGLYNSIYTDYDSLNDFIKNYAPSQIEIIQLPYDNCIELLKDLIQKINLSDLWRLYDFIF